MGWQSFSIGAGETTRFVQPSSSSMALNRVYGGTRSMIEGRLEANGGVILVNPAGITVTKSGVVNVNTFIGSTHDITDDEFLKGGSLNFKGSSDASVENYGTIHAETGDIALIARTVRNEGTLSAPKGVVGLAAGDEVLYQPNADERLLVKSPTASAALIHHSGSIVAAAAEIKAAGNPYAVAINLDGVIEARGHAAAGIKPHVIVHAEQGDIKVGSAAAIFASDELGGGLVSIRAATGNLQLDGKVSTAFAMGKGGEIRILGNNITVSGTALLDASGATGGGNIFVGGDYQGGANPDKHYASESLQNASTLRIDKGAVMNADATVQGDGGVLINWADGTTVSSGSVTAKGGPLGGNGGFVEISGKQNLGFDGTVDLGAAKGTPGTVLFDPASLYILNGITFGANPTIFSSYILDPSSPIINIGDLENYPIGAADPTYGLGLIFDSELNKINSGTIILNAAKNVVFYSDIYYGVSNYGASSIILKSGVNLVITAPTISIWNDTSIISSGTGYITFNASTSVEIISAGIMTDSGSITLNSPTINLTSASFTSTAGGKVALDKTTYTSSINPIPSTLGVVATSSSIQITPVTTTTSAPIAVISPTTATTPTPEPAITQAAIAAAPTVQNTLQSLTIRNTTTTSSGGSFGSAGPSGEGSSSATTATGGVSTSGGETASSSSSGESSSGGETASSESSSGSSAEGGAGESSSTTATASSDSSGSSSSGTSSGGGTASSSSSAGGTSTQGAKSQAAAVARLNNPLQGGMVGGGEFQRLNPFSGAEGMHEDHASAGGGAGGAQPTASGRAAAISVKSPEMQELSSLNDLNVVLMLF